MPISDLDDAQLAKLAAAAELIKVGFDPSQPRDERGRWSSDGGASGASEAASVQSPTLAKGRAMPAALCRWQAMVRVKRHSRSR
jgi:hypothetical protein